MQERKKQILDAAVRLFAAQGFHATSIQDIVNELGMAKGSVYFYFKSKDELLVSIFRCYGDQLLQGMAEHPGEEELPARERLRLQLERQLRFFKTHASFMLMMLKEPFSGAHHQKLQTFALQFRSQHMNWLYRHIAEIYGSETERYWPDGAMLFSGILNPYMLNMAYDHERFDEWRLSHFLIRRLDDIMAGMTAAGEPPITTHFGIRRIIDFGLEGEGQLAGTPGPAEERDCRHRSRGYRGDAGS